MLLRTWMNQRSTLPPAIRFVAAISLFAASGCSHQPPAAAPVPQGSATPDVRIEPGDRLFIHMWGEERLSDTALVDARGQVSLPKVGLMDITTIPIPLLRDSLQARFSKFFRQPAVEVVALRRIAVSGAVYRPNIYYVDVSTTLRDAIALAGGVSESGNATNVFVVRGAEEIPIPNWQREQTLIGQLRSGDQVVVGRRSWLQMNALQVASFALVVASFALSLRR
jgi:protein involved in polysaccharide export with SLBB domain